MPDPRGMITAIVLAAGMSKRMGRNKLLLEVEGRPILLRAIDSLLASGLHDIIVVTGHEADVVRACCSEYGDEVHFVHNPLYASGRATSVQAGLGVLPGDAVAAMVMPGDVPFVSSQLIAQLIAEFAESGLITFPMVEGRKGHPVIFPASAFGLLRELKQDETLNDYLLAHPGETHPVETDDHGCLRDIDSPEDLRQSALDHLSPSP